MDLPELSLKWLYQEPRIDDHVVWWADSNHIVHYVKAKAPLSGMPITWCKLSSGALTVVDKPVSCLLCIAEMS